MEAQTKSTSPALTPPPLEGKLTSRVFSLSPFSGAHTTENYQKPKSGKWNSSTVGITALNICPGEQPGNIEYKDGNDYKNSSILHMGCNMAFGLPTCQYEQTSGIGRDHYQFKDLQTMHCDMGSTHFAFNSYSVQDGSQWRYPLIATSTCYPQSIVDQLGASQFLQFHDGAMGWYNCSPSEATLEGKGPTHAGLYLSPARHLGIGLDEPQERLHINGNVRIGWPGGAPEPAKLLFSCQTNLSAQYEDNSDQMYIVRDDEADDHGVLKVNLGDDGVPLRDKIEFGYHKYNGEPAATGGWNRAVAIYASGELYARKVKVTLDAYPDYVFAPGYKLRSLYETEAYIKAHHHLPELPAAAEVEKNGADLGELHKALLKQVEELTLQVIALKKEVDGLRLTKK